MAKKGFTDGYKTYDTSAGHGNRSKWQKAFEERTHTAGEGDQTDFSKACALLGVTGRESPTELKRVFRHRVKEWHPDRNAHRLQEAEEMTKAIIAAYDLLKASGA